MQSYALCRVRVILYMVVRGTRRSIAYRVYQTVCLRFSSVGIQHSSAETPVKYRRRSYSLLPNPFSFFLFFNATDQEGFFSSSTFSPATPSSRLFMNTTFLQKYRLLGIRGNGMLLNHQRTIETSSSGDAYNHLMLPPSNQTF